MKQHTTQAFEEFDLPEPLQKNKGKKISPDQFAEILNLLKDRKDTYVQFRRVIALTLMYVTGLRQKEIVSLRKGSVESFFKNKPIRVDIFDPKWEQGSGYYVALTLNGLKFLNRYKSHFQRVSTF